MSTYFSFLAFKRILTNIGWDTECCSLLLVSQLVVNISVNPKLSLKLGLTSRVLDIFYLILKIVFTTFSSSLDHKQLPEKVFSDDSLFWFILKNQKIDSLTSPRKTFYLKKPNIILRVKSTEASNLAATANLWWPNPPKNDIPIKLNCILNYVP